ncbi:MAG: hypothetical protein ACNA8L_07440 [Luteolibacter sp.]|jgi:hypothetical protein
MDAPEAPIPAAEEKPRSGSCLIRGLIITGIVVACIVLLVFWYNRPIRPVVLTEPEMAIVEEKIAAMQPVAGDEPASNFTGETSVIDPYLPGKREISFTDRELNGMLNEHTALGDQIAFQFTPGKILARIETPLPEDLPIVGGTKLRARAKFAVDASGPSPVLALEDFTVWGVSIPNDWLHGIKNVNLLEQAFGAEDNKGIPGVESLSIEDGRLLILLKE